MPDSTQRLLVRQLKKLGYHGSVNGMCFGISCMTVLAILNNNLDTLDERYRLLTTYKNEKTLAADIKAVKARVIAAKKAGKTITLTENDELLIDILAYFDSIELYQQPHRYPTLFGEHSPKQQSVIRTAEINQKKLHSLLKITNIYDKSSLKKLLDDLEPIIKQCQQPIPIMVLANNHAITIYYDHNKGWIIIDPNTLPSQTLAGTDELSEKIINAYQLRGETHARLCMHIDLLSDLPISDKNIQKKLDRVHQAQLDKISSKLANESLPNVRPKYETLLSLAVSEGDDTVVKKILGKKPNTTIINEAIWLAIKCDQPTIFKQLLKKASLDQAKLSNCMQQACSQGRDDIINTLINHDPQLVNITLSEMLGPTPLLMAIDKNRLSTIQLLLAHQANIEKVNYDGVTPLLLAARRQNFFLTKQLIEQGANTAAIDTRGHTLLATAALSGSKTLVELALQYAPALALNPISKNRLSLIEELLTSTHHKRKYWKVAEYLLSKGATLTPEQTLRLQGNYYLNINVNTAKKKHYPHLVRLLTTPTSLNKRSAFNSSENNSPNECTGSEPDTTPKTLRH